MTRLEIAARILAAACCSDLLGDPNDEMRWQDSVLRARRSWEMAGALLEVAADELPVARDSYSTPGVVHRDYGRGQVYGDSTDD